MLETKNTIDTSFNNNFERQLEASGYRWFRDNWKNCIRGFQKKFTDEKGVKYFITGYHYNHYKQGLNQAPDRDTYTFDIQFRLKGDKEPWVDLQYHADFLDNEYRPTSTLKDAEEFYEKMWQQMGGKYYELYDYVDDSQQNNEQ
jgi:hypothetical protein